MELFGIHALCLSSNTACEKPGISATQEYVDLGKDIPLPEGLDLTQAPPLATCRTQPINSEQIQPISKRVDEGFECREYISVKQECVDLGDGAPLSERLESKPDLPLSTSRTQPIDGQQIQPIFKGVGEGFGHRASGSGQLEEGNGGLGWRAASARSGWHSCQVNPEEPAHTGLAERDLSGQTGTAVKYPESTGQRSMRDVSFEDWTGQRSVVDVSFQDSQTGSGSGQDHRDTKRSQLGAPQGAEEGVCKSEVTDTGQCLIETADSNKPGLHRRVPFKMDVEGGVHGCLRNDDCSVGNSPAKMCSVTSDHKSACLDNFGICGPPPGAHGVILTGQSAAPAGSIQHTQSQLEGSGLTMEDLVAACQEDDIWQLVATPFSRRLSGRVRYEGGRNPAFESTPAAENFQCPLQPAAQQQQHVVAGLLDGQTNGSIRVVDEQDTRNAVSSRMTGQQQPGAASSLSEGPTNGSNRVMNEEPSVSTSRGKGLTASDTKTENPVRGQAVGTSFAVESFQFPSRLTVRQQPGGLNDLPEAAVNGLSRMLDEVASVQNRSKKSKAFSDEKDPALKKKTKDCLGGQPIETPGVMESFPSMRQQQGSSVPELPQQSGNGCTRVVDEIATTSVARRKALTFLDEKETGWEKKGQDRLVDQSSCMQAPHGLTGDNSNAPGRHPAFSDSRRLPGQVLGKFPSSPELASKNSSDLTNGYVTYVVKSSERDSLAESHATEGCGVLGQQDVCIGDDAAHLNVMDAFSGDHMASPRLPSSSSACPMETPRGSASVSSVEPIGKLYCNLCRECITTSEAGRDTGAWVFERMTLVKKRYLSELLCQNSQDHNVQDASKRLGRAVAVIPLGEKELAQDLQALHYGQEDDCGNDDLATDKSVESCENSDHERGNSGPLANGCRENARDGVVEAADIAEDWCVVGSRTARSVSQRAQPLEGKPRRWKVKRKRRVHIEAQVNAGTPKKRAVPEGGGHEEIPTVWMEEDGCVFKPIACLGCPEGSQWLGVKVLATDLENSNLNGLVLVFSDAVHAGELTDQHETSTAERVMNASVAGDARVSGEPIGKEDVMSRQQRSFGEASHRVINDITGVTKARLSQEAAQASEAMIAASASLAGRRSANSVKCSPVESALIFRQVLCHPHLRRGPRELEEGSALRWDGLIGGHQDETLKQGCYNIFEEEQDVYAALEEEWYLFLEMEVEHNTDASINSRDHVNNGDQRVQVAGANMGSRTSARTETTTTTTTATTEP
ncbi:hypothetical protein CBR_g12295 [Chara braunii]|uniref:Uncharacterized protein n=1 Tax=Chara braunii TaxID=69332 RepID=A0A388KRQ6_CHABU|nr:hypothetical protein CBR_g12295 [Chara braunii]|eukprot:GBG72726.1 hypothetical protein CBR_g12295 [Chara braunii]